MCADIGSVAGNRPQAGVPVRGFGEVDWERARVGGLGKGSARFYPCIAHGRLPRDALAGFLEQFGVNVAR